MAYRHDDASLLVADPEALSAPADVLHERFIQRQESPLLRELLLPQPLLLQQLQPQP